MRKIICDQFGLHLLQTGDYLVIDEKQFEKAYNILSSPEIHDIGCIVVSNPALFHWFDAPARKYSCSVTTLNPVVELTALLNRPGTQLFFQDHPEWVIELELMDKAEQEKIRSNESPESWLYRVVFGPSWQIEGPIDSAALSNILQWLATHEENDLHCFTRQLLSRRLAFWATGDTEWSTFFNWLGKAPFDRAKVLIWAQMLNRYPQNIVASWFQHIVEWNALQFLPECFRSFPGLEVRLPEGISVFLKTFLEEEWGKSPVQALSFISGKLEIERTFLSSKLQNLLRQGIPLEWATYQKISQLDAFPETVALAGRLIPAKEPSFLPDSASIEVVQDWLRDEYLPFYDSCATLNITEKTELFVEQFENWLKKNYGKLLIDGQGMAYRQIGELKSRLEDGPILVYVFDGLNYLGGQNVLLPVLEQAGVYPEKGITPYLTFLPSETFIAKPTVVCGWMNSQLPLERPDAAFYRKLVQDSFGLSEAEVASATDQDSTLYELIQNPSRVYLYLDNQLDREYLHSSMTPYARREKYTIHIKKQAEAIVEAAHVVKDQYDANLLIIACSDHGFTELPQKIKTLEPQVPKIKKTRSIVIDQSLLVETEDEKYIWRLKPGLFGLHTEMAIPLGYSCFGKKPKGATHGGCTPQEVAVPWFLFSFQRPNPAISPVIAIDGVIFRKRKDNLVKVSFSNPNDFSISIIEISMEGVEIITALPFRVLAKQVITTEATFDATGVNDVHIEINGTFAITHRLGKQIISVNLSLETKGAMVDEFDDDFEC